jgi:quercetin dioxygenase-like cupin family protein
LPASALVDIASGLARTADVWRGRLAADPTQRTGFRLIATPEYDVWLLHWPPGTSVAPHDHGPSAGVFAVAAGELYEVRWYGETRCRRRVLRGESVTVPRGVVHDVLAGDGPALSVHVYSPPLTSMSYYDDDGGRSRVDRQVVEGGAVMIEPRAVHPSAGH